MLSQVRPVPPITGLHAFLSALVGATANWNSVDRDILDSKWWEPRMGNSSNTAQPAATADAAKPAAVKFRDFLESSPPDALAQISYLLIREVYTNNGRYLDAPAIQLHCDHALCKGVRWFSPTDTNFISGSLDYEFVKYQCKNCSKTQKVFALLVAPDSPGVAGRVLK